MLRIVVTVRLRRIEIDQPIVNKCPHKISGNLSRMGRCFD
jgi:hypothetical protein